MLLKGIPLQTQLYGRQHGRATAVVRCSASTVEPNVSTPPRQGVPRDGPADGSAGAHTVSDAVTQTHRLGRKAGARGMQSDSQQSQKATLLPLFVFMEDDVDFISRKATDVYQKHFLEGNGVVVRSLGRQGAAGAMRFLLALREAGDATASASAGLDRPERCDVQLRLQPQESLKHFGTPLMMFALPAKGRFAALPEEGSPLCKAFAVSNRTDVTRLAKSIVRELTVIQPGHFLRLDMVGTEALHRGLQGLSDGIASLSSTTGSYYAVPELVSVPMRARQRQAQQQQEGQSQQYEAVAEAASPAAAEASPAGGADEPAPRAQVLRLYVARSQPAGIKNPRLAGRGTAEAASVDGVQGGGDGGGRVASMEVAEELAALRGALGNMMEQQKLLERLIGEQQAAAEAARQQQQQQ